MSPVWGRPQPKYTIVGETFRHVIPSHMQCSLGCGGRACKYEDPTHWSEEKQAIKGLYSSWITENLLAMARPSTEIIKKYDIIDQFKRCGLKTVINLQSPGEHASCGSPLEPECGFTYRPEVFMEAGIYFYNFGWKDYGVASLKTILDMVKVMSFALQEGKIAIHCHAGLGRTGVLLACYLVFTTRMTADHAVVFVRKKRPNSIQTRGQLLCIREFAKFLAPMRNIFCIQAKAKAVTLSEFLIRQQHLLHGYEARRLKHMPKLVQLVCRLLLDIAENRQVVEEELLEVPELSAELVDMPPQQKETSEHGIPRLPGPLVSPRCKAEPPLFYARKSLCYSESDLQRLQGELKLLGNCVENQTNVENERFFSHKKMEETSPYNTELTKLHKQNSFYNSAGSVWEQMKLADEPLPPHRRKFLKDRLRSKSLGFSIERKRVSVGAILSTWLTDGVCVEGGGDVPLITLQTELTLENRRLLVAQALSVDLEDEDVEKQYRIQVLDWQRELNSTEGAWESLCTERDPFILSGLMWSFLEELKEPVISIKDINTLEANTPNFSCVLDLLEKGSKQTLTCILDCLAHLLVIPEEIESAFLNRTVKAFTKIQMESEDGKDMFKTMKDILKPLVHDMRTKVMETLQCPKT